MNGINSQTATVDYLQLLTVQLRNQDPIDPVDQEGLINDLTQFSILEGLEDLNASFDQMLQLQQVTQGMSLVGKEVSYQDPNTGEVLKGIADEVFIASDAINVLVGEDSIPVSQIIGVSQAHTS